jgi:type IV pilus assembly protein PilB
MAKRVISKQLGELLIERGVISRQQLDSALEIQKEKGGLIGQVLVDLGYASEESIAQAITSQYGFPYLPLENYEIDPDVVKIVPKNVASQFCLVPVDKIGNNLTIAMSNPLNALAIEDIELISNLCVQIFVSTATDINKAIEKYYK